MKYGRGQVHFEFANGQIPTGQLVSDMLSFHLASVTRSMVKKVAATGSPARVRVDFTNGGGGFANGVHAVGSDGTIECEEGGETITIAHNHPDVLSVTFAGGGYGDATTALYQRREVNRESSAGVGGGLIGEWEATNLRSGGDPGLPDEQFITITEDAARDAFESKCRGKVSKLFAAMDTDGSGILDKDELVAGILKMDGPRSGFAPTAAEVAEVMADFDTDQVTV